MINFNTIDQAQARNEQRAIEATREYQTEQSLHDLENALNALDRIAEEADEREALQSAGLGSR
jgi:chaperonin cofactor prefoldin